MIQLLVIFFIVKLYARTDTFEHYLAFIVYLLTLTDMLGHWSYIVAILL